MNKIDPANKNGFSKMYVMVGQSNENINSVLKNKMCSIKIL